MFYLGLGLSLGFGLFSDFIRDKIVLVWKLETSTTDWDVPSLFF